MNSEIPITYNQNLLYREPQQLINCTPPVALTSSALWNRTTTRVPVLAQMQLIEFQLELLMLTIVMDMITTI